MIGKLDTARPQPGPVVVTVFDRDRIADYQRMVAGAAQRRHPRRALSRQSEGQSRPADEICRQAQLALRHHPGRATRRRAARCRSRTWSSAPSSPAESKERDEYLKKQARRSSRWRKRTGRRGAQGARPPRHQTRLSYRLRAAACRQNKFRRARFVPASIPCPFRHYG